MAREGGRLGGSKAPGREGDPRDKRIEQQDREISRLRGELARATRDRDRWKRRSERLKKQLDEARRAGRRQAAPFAKDRPQGRGRHPGRRAGARYGRQGCRPRPRQVDEAFAAPVPTACPDCGGAVDVTRVASQYQEELPEVRPLVRRFDIEVGHCSQCRRRVQGRHALQTSDALGAAGVQLGPGVVGLVVEMHTEMGVPLAKVANLLRNTFNLNVTPGGLARLLHRAARDATPAYQELCEQVRNAPVVTPDETGWRVGGGRHWLWAYATADTTVYAICPGRGFDDAATVLGTDYAGVLVRDGWQVYRCYKDSLHQSCINHLLRRAKALQEDHPYSPWGAEVKAVLQAGLDVRDRCQNGELTRRGLDVLRGRLEARLGRLIDAPPPLEDAKRFARHLANEFPAVFLFLRDPSIDATNWRAEQAIRPAVVIRKVCGGNRTRRGADTQQVLSSVVRTARQRGLDVPGLFAEMLRAPAPVVPEVLGLPPPPGVGGRHWNDRFEARGGCAVHAAATGRVSKGGPEGPEGSLPNMLGRRPDGAALGGHGPARPAHACTCIRRLLPHRDHGDDPCEAHCPAKVTSARALAFPVPNRFQPAFSLNHPVNKYAAGSSARG